jgi:hypothetical protein
MRIRMRRPASAGVLCTATLMLLALGCNADKVTKPPVDTRYLAQSSPENCLENLKRAYNERDIEEYGRLFTEDFTFEFSQVDWSRPDNPTPKTWGFDQEQTSARNMFTDHTVQKIELTYVVNPAADSGGEHAGTWKIAQDRIYLRLTTLKEDGTTLILLIDAANDTFYFKEYPEEAASDGGHLWRIALWQDEPLGGKTERTTWGTVKNLWF